MFGLYDREERLLPFICHSGRDESASARSVYLLCTSNRESRSYSTGSDITRAAQSYGP
jgi:hypothetical protein